MSFRYQQPSNEDDFEEFCLRLMTKHFKCTTLQLYGKRGEKQDGIDIIDIAGVKPLRGGQCKHHEITKTLAPNKLEAEVRKVIDFEFPLDEYYLLTTAKKSTGAQKRVIKLNGEKLDQQTFTITLWTWQEIEGLLSDLNDFDRDYVINGRTGRDTASIKNMMEEVGRDLLAGNSLVATDHILQSRLECAETLIKNGNKELAKYELEQIDQLSTAFDTKTNRYLIKRLNAKLLMLKGDFEEAATLFLEAFNEQPDLEQARINRAIAFDLLDNDTRAFELANKLKDEGVRSEPIPAILFRTAPKPIDSDLRKWLDDFLDTSEELNLSIGMQCLDEGNYNEALMAAERARKINDKSSRAALVEAMVFHTRGVAKRGNARDADLKTAYTKYQLALSNETDELPERAKPDALRNLSSVQYLLGKDDPNQSFEKAIEHAKDKAPYIGSYLNYLCATEDFETARFFLSKLPPNAEFEDAGFLRNVIEYNTNPEADRSALIQSMFELGASSDKKRRMECLVFGVQWSIQSGLVKNALAKIESLKESVKPITYHTCIAWMEFERGNMELARQSALSAKESMNVDSDNQLVSLLGRLFLRLEDQYEALPLFQRCADVTKLSNDTRALLDCAIRVRRHDIVLDVCEKLRFAGANDSKALDLEIQLLSRYQPSKALALLEQLLANDGNNKRLYTYQCFLKTGLKGRVDDLELNKLLQWDEISVAESHLVLVPLIAAKHFDAAIEFAYAQLRANWHEELAHGRYMWLFMQYARRSRLSLEFSKVGDGCAIHYKEGDNQLKTLIVDGKSTEPLANDEVRPDSEIGRILDGAVVGDEIGLSKSHIQPRTIQVDSIQSKYVYRYQDVLQNMQIRFAGSSLIQMIKMEHEGEFDISPIVQGLQERRNHVHLILDEFKRIPAAISFLSKWLGLSYFDTHDALSVMPEIGIRCCMGRNPGLEETLEKLRNTKRMVLDFSGVATIHKLDLWEKLGQYKLIVARSTVDEINEWASNLEQDGLKRRGTTFLDEKGQLRLMEFTPEQMSERENRARNLLNHLKVDCETLESELLPSQLPETREFYEKLESISILESLLLAKETDTVLLADDVFVHLTAASDYCIPSVWTQVLLDELKRETQIQHSYYLNCNANLICWNYGPIHWNAEFVFAGGELASWDVSRLPLSSILRQFANEGVSLKQRCRIAVELFREVYFASSVSSLLHTSIIHAVLDQLNNRRAIELIRLDATERLMPYESMLNDLILHLKMWRENHVRR